jgi:putative DNA primase/helicase
VQRRSRAAAIPAKNNLGDDKTGYAFRIEGGELPGGITTSSVAWEPEAVKVTADEALAANGGERQPRKADIAADWLRAELAAGPVASEELQAGAKAAGLSWATVRRAGDAIGIIVRRDGFGAGGQWAWALPDDPGFAGEIEL